MDRGHHGWYIYYVPAKVVPVATAAAAARVGVGRWQGKARVVITAVAIYILTHIIAIIG